ncbi:MAG: hypothetical protein KA169_18685 [Burkholderiaceae bacterium]|nr:hypothetical protein [Burkholderiaceae bacterium]MBP6816923.1 hypothetical protein [Burkholderiaceae bacterium]
MSMRGFTGRLRWSLAAAMLLSMLAAPGVRAAGFAAAASPSRFELEAKPGDVLSRTLDLQHIGPEGTEYVIRSADWILTEEKGLEFFDALQPGSCRPWLRLERRAVRLEPRVRRKLRFEVHVPADAPVGECRLAILVENYDQRAIPLIKDSPIQLPLTGRLGVIVYVAVGGAQPKISLVSVAMGEDNGERVPMVTVRNDGNAHGRLEGALRGTDADGKTVFFPVSTLPVLPGQTRRLPLLPAENLTTKKKPGLRYPVTLSGRLDWDNGGFDIQAQMP